MGRFDASGGTCRATGNGNTSQIEVGLHDVGGNSLEPDIQDLIEVIRLDFTVNRKVNPVFGQSLDNFLLEVVEPLPPGLFLLRTVNSDRLGKGRHRWHVFGPGSPFGFLVATLEVAREVDAIP